MQLNILSIFLSSAHQKIKRQAINQRKYKNHRNETLWKKSLASVPAAVTTLTGSTLAQPLGSITICQDFSIHG